MRKGNDKVLDEALAKKEIMEEFLKQAPDEIVEFEDSVKRLVEIVSQ